MSRCSRLFKVCHACSQPIRFIFFPTANETYFTDVSTVSKNVHSESQSGTLKSTLDASSQMASTEIDQFTSRKTSTQPTITTFDFSPTALTQPTTHLLKNVEITAEVRTPTTPSLPTTDATVSRSPTVVTQITTSLSRNVGSTSEVRIAATTPSLPTTDVTVSRSPPAVTQITSSLPRNVGSTSEVRTAATTPSLPTTDDATSIPPTPLPPKCIMGNMFRDKCYLSVDDKASWFDANSFCAILGGHLATIPDPSTQVS